MKTLTRVLQTATIAAALGCGSAALADPFRGGPGPGREGGGRPEYGRGHGDPERRHEPRGWRGSHWRVVPFPFVALPRLFLPPPPRFPPPPVQRVIVPAEGFWPPPTPPVVYAQPVPPPLPVQGCGGQVRVIIGLPPPAW